MILTITLNPSVDICYYIDQFKPDDVNRCSNYLKTAGGKGVNVAKVLNNLGCHVVATGFLGGGTGQFIVEELNKISVIPRFVKISEDTRNCIAIISQGTQTEILESGPNISREEASSFLQSLADILDENNIKVVAASGSIPGSIPDNFYAEIIKIVKQRNVKFILDTSGPYLQEGLKASPYLIKPNISELESLVDRKLQSQDQLISALQELKEYNIEMVVVSLGEDGCIALCGQEIYQVTIPKVKIKNPVGSGDAMVAGMAKEIANTNNYAEILRVGTTCGILNALNTQTGFIDISYYPNIYDKIKIEVIK